MNAIIDFIFIFESLSQVISNQRKQPILRKNCTGPKAIIHGSSSLGREIELAEILYAYSTQLDILNGSRISFIAPS